MTDAETAFKAVRRLDWRRVRAAARERNIVVSQCLLLVVCKGTLWESDLKLRVGDGDASHRVRLIFSVRVLTPSMTLPFY